MTLDDFFTLTEMNNGLTAPYRVRELMAVMQKERDHVAKNTADSTRQWSAVASAIAATENKDCIDLFIELDGLNFISKWLKDAKNFSADTIDNFVEESITHVLRALEKMHVDYEKLVDTEIWTSVQDLLVHNSSKVQDNARVLFESWKAKRYGDASLPDVDRSSAFVDGEAGNSADIEGGLGLPEYSQGDASICRATSAEGKGHEITRYDPVVSTSSDTAHTDQVESAHNSDTKMAQPVGDERPLDLVSSPSLPKPTIEPPPCHSIDSASEPCIPAVSGQDTLDTRIGFHNLESPSYIKQSLKIEGLPEKLGSFEESKTSESRCFTSSSVAIDEMKAVTEVISQKETITRDKNSCNEGLSLIDIRTIDSDGNGARDDTSDANQCSSAHTAKEGIDVNYQAMPKSSGREKRRGNSKDLGSYLSRIEDEGKVSPLCLRASNSDLSDNYSFGKKRIDNEPDRAGKKPDVEIDYGILDPLEVARQVAIEVERDYRSQSCSSSGTEGNTVQHNSPNSVSRTRNERNANEGSHKEVPDDPNSSDESSAMEEESPTSSGNLDAEEKNGTQDMATSQVTEAAQEEANTEKGLCDFDLNEEVHMEDSDHPVNQFSAPVSVVSASRAAAAPGLPGAPLQFEGNLGWKGSAVTSAFRPASPRRMPDSDKDPSTGGSSNSSKQRQGCLDFDLNAESADARTGDLSPGKHIQLYPGLPSGESSVELNSRRSENLELDLNHSSEDGGALSDWRIAQFFPQGNCHHNQSHSSSSSKQPVRNIDLNDQPSFRNDSPDISYLSKASQSFNIFGGIKSDDSAISIMGTRVEVSRKDLVSHTPPLPNGRTPEVGFDVSLGRTGNFLGVGPAVQYAHPSVYGYNNMAPALAMPFSSTVYGSGGPFPYMVDSRGAPVIPQIVGSTSALPTAFSQPPFLINMNSSTPPNGVGPSRSSFDLNSGMFVESGNRDPAGFGLFLNSAQARSMDEQLRSNSQPTISSAINGKRKEPDNGFENYPFKHFIPPWKHN